MVVLTSVQCAERYQLLTRSGVASSDAWRRLVRSGHMPSPLDDELDSSLWRWSVVVLDEFDRLGRREFMRRQAAGTLFADGGAVATDSDLTSPHGFERFTIVGR